MLDSLSCGQLASRDSPARISAPVNGMQISALDFGILVLYLAGITLVWRPLPAWPAKSARLFPRRPHRAVVGARLLHCRDRNLHTHHHRDASDRLRRKPRIPATRAGLLSGAGDSLRGTYTTIFPRGILHRLPASGKALRDAHEVCRGGRFHGDACVGRGCADFGHRESGERGVWNGRSHFDFDHYGPDDVLYV